MAAGGLVRLPAILEAHGVGPVRVQAAHREGAGGGRRVQRCYGCFIAFHLKDMYLGDDVSFYCENCKDESMFHFDDFSKLMDPSKLREAEDEHHHH